MTPDPPRNWVSTPGYEGPDRRADRMALSEALAGFRGLAPDLRRMAEAQERLAASQEHFADTIRTEKETTRRFRMNLLGLIVIGLVVIGGFGVLYARQDNANSQQSDTLAELRRLAARVEDCTTPGGKCFETNTLPARRATIEAHQQILCVLRFPIEVRTDQVFQDCEKGAK